MDATKAEKQSGALGYDLSLAGNPLFHSNPAPKEARMEYEKLNCSLFARCEGCPYLGHGFVCWHNETRCLRTEIEQINQRKESP